MLENLLEARRDNHGPGGCKVAKLFEKIETKDADILSKVLENEENYSTLGIFKGLRDSGIDVGYGSLHRHRRGLCACWRPNA